MDEATDKDQALWKEAIVWANEFLDVIAEAGFDRLRGSIASTLADSYMARKILIEKGYKADILDLSVIAREVPAKK